MAEAGGVRLGTRFRRRADATTQVRGDAAELGRVLANLVVNAIRHTPSDGAVEVSARAGRHECVLAVSDGCGGLDDEACERVFDAGWRGDPRPDPGHRRRGRARAWRSPGASSRRTPARSASRNSRRGLPLRGAAASVERPPAPGRCESPHGTRRSARRVPWPYGVRPPAPVGGPRSAGRRTCPARRRRVRRSSLAPWNSTASSCSFTFWASASRRSAREASFASVAVYAESSVGRTARERPGRRDAACRCRTRRRWR